MEKNKNDVCPDKTNIVFFYIVYLGVFLSTYYCLTS